MPRNVHPVDYPDCLGLPRVSERAASEILEDARMRVAVLSDGIALAERIRRAADNLQPLRPSRIHPNDPGALPAEIDRIREMDGAAVVDEIRMAAHYLHTVANRIFDEYAQAVAKR
jgi:hypothetical protein